MRRSGWLIAGVIALGIAGAASWSLADRGRLTEVVRDRMEEATGRHVTISAIDLQWQPFPALVMRDVRVDNPAWARRPHFLEASRIAAAPSWRALLSGRIEAGRLLLEQPVLALETSAQGRHSWDGIGMANKTDKASKPDALAGLRRIEIRDALIHTADTSHANDAAAWRIASLELGTDAGLRGVQVIGRIVHRQQTLDIQAAFDDLSAVGQPGAATQGSVVLRWPTTHVSLTGRLPLDGGMQGLSAALRIDADEPAGLLHFFGIAYPRIAPIKTTARLEGTAQKVALESLRFQLGQLDVAGDADVALRGSRPVIQARLRTPRMDWGQTLADAGRPPLPPKPPGELFRMQPLGLWAFLEGTRNSDVTLDLQMASLTLRSGIVTRQAAGKLHWGDGRMQVPSYSAHLLGGTVSGSVNADVARQTMQLRLDLRDASLGEGLLQTGRDAPLSGGPMRLAADVAMHGATPKQLAASLTGPVRVSIGAARFTSPKTAQAQHWLTGLVSANGSGSPEIAVECMAAYLPFDGGKASASPIVGLRSSDSQLLTHGSINLASQTLDLRGRIKPRSASKVGVSTLAGELRIGGKIVAPDVGLSTTGKAGTAARIGLAVATAGISMVGTYLWDSAASNPCEVVFEKRRDGMVAQVGERGK